MGMDVYGKNPISEAGSYFRNNVWYWRPLWDYVAQVGSDVIDGELAEHGHYNDGAGLDEDGALALAQILAEELESGRTETYERKNNEYFASLPREACEWCNATGIRTDKVGEEMKMSEKELSPEMQILMGRTHGWCNACQGVGTRESFEANYPFKTENVREFATFLKDCGGFEIW
jgi:hypothetical protein